jgi:hypothetical protein
MTPGVWKIRVEMAGFTAIEDQLTVTHEPGYKGFARAATGGC